MHVFGKTFLSILKMLGFLMTTLWNRFNCLTVVAHKFVTVPKQMLLCDGSVLDMFIFNTAYLICIFTMCREV